MSNDLVAELVLKFRSEMNGGIDQIRDQFLSLERTLQELRQTLTTLNETMAALRAPAQLTEGLAGVAGSALDATKAVTGIGTALDADTASVRALVQEMQAVPGAAATAAAAASEAAAGAGGALTTRPNWTYYTPPPGQAEDEPFNEPGPVPLFPDQDKAHRKGAHSSFLEGNWLMDILIGASGWEGAQQYAEMQKTALQTAIIEGFSGPAALTKANHILEASNKLAYLTGTNVQDVENAYGLLIRQHLPNDLVNNMMEPLAEASFTYDTPIQDLVGPMFNLAEQFKVPGDQMKRAIAILGLASHEGHYWFKNFTSGLPEVSNEFSMLGDTGIAGEIHAAAALETIMRGTNDAGKTSTDLSYLMSYMTSGIAARFFDRSKRSEDLLGKDVSAIFDKYHIGGLNLPEYFNSARDKGIDPLDAMVAYMHTIGAEKMSPTDQSFAFTSLFHSKEAATAMMALLQNYDYYKGLQLDLAKVSPSFLDENFGTASEGVSYGFNNFAHSLGYFYRGLGNFVYNPSELTPPAPTLLDIEGKNQQGSPLLNVTPTIPITVNVHMDKNGNVTVDGGLTGAPNTPPGTNVRVNQGTILGGW